MVSSNTVVVVIPTIGRDYVSDTLPKVIQNGEKSLRKAGFQPIFIIEDSTQNGLSREVIEALTKTNTQIRYSAAPNMGANEAWSHGFELGSKMGAKLLLACCDDFVTEAKQLDKLVMPVFRGKTEFTTGSWPKNSHSILSFPKPQYLNEIWVSRLMNYAIKGYDPQKVSGNPFLDNPHKLQTFTGLFCLTSRSSEKIEAEMHKLFGNASPELRKKISGWGADPLRILIASAMGIKVINTPISSRRFEHPNPKKNELERFVNSRLAQYNNAVDVIREFLIRTNQQHKLDAFNLTAKIISDRILGLRTSKISTINRVRIKRNLILRTKKLQRIKKLQRAKKI
jgi:hypothetical protein